MTHNPQFYIVFVDGQSDRSTYTPDFSEATRRADAAKSASPDSRVEVRSSSGVGQYTAKG